MKKIYFILSLALPVVLCSCATPPPQAFHNTDNTALVVKSLDNGSGQIVAPTAMSKVDNWKVLDQIKTLGRLNTAVVVLENYTEPQLGQQFRDRSFGWFMGLRGLGFEHIVFLQGKGVAEVEGLPVLAEYQ